MDDMSGASSLKFGTKKSNGSSLTSGMLLRLLACAGIFWFGMKFARIGSFSLGDLTTVIVWVVIAIIGFVIAFLAMKHEGRVTLPWVKALVMLVFSVGLVGGIYILVRLYINPTLSHEADAVFAAGCTLVVLFGTATPRFSLRKQSDQPDTGSPSRPVDSSSRAAA